MHISSLPGRFGIGDLGPEAFKFADFLFKTKQTYWQILPLTPPNRFIGWSPYDCLSAFAGNTMLISPELLYKSGLLSKRDILNVPKFSKTRVEFEKVYNYKTRLLDKAFEKFGSGIEKDKFKNFCSQNDFWLNDYSIFFALMEKYKTPDWSQWPEDHQIDETVEQNTEKAKVLQFLFFEQWRSLKQYCNIHGIKIIGDIPIYVAYQGCDAWANQKIFKLKNKKLIFKSGVPPDYFSKTGQLWGNPVYNWPYIKQTNYKWWMDRMGQNLKLFDMVRIDHFRGLVKFWQVPGNNKNAVKGKWVPGPGEEFFKILFKKFPHANIIVEDLGFITPDVKRLMEKLSLTGMKILLFAFGDNCGKSGFLPHNYIENCIAYTGTHDNHTIRDWFTNQATPQMKRNLFEYLGRKVSVNQLNWELIRLTMSSVARTAIIPVQDILNLGAESRMNNPAEKFGNWHWRMKDGLLDNKITDKLAEFTRIYGRVNC